jgi:hydrogenase/urease accessory protein HupE
MKPLIALLISSLIGISSVSAHPAGHEGGFLETAIHMITQPDHLLGWSAALLLATFLVWKGFRARQTSLNR